MSRTPSIAPLETIYEESGSFVGSINSSQYKPKDESIITVSNSSIDIQSQRAYNNYQKPPIEVRFRDGSKRYIPPLNSRSMITNRRNFLDSSYDTLSSKTTSTQRSLQSKPPLVVTIITAEDLKQAGITSSSSDASNFSSRTTSPMENIHHESLKLRNITPSFSIPSSEQFFTTSTPQLLTSSLQVKLTNDENEKPLSLNSILTNKTVNQTIQPNTTILVQGKMRSAFRPFLKSVRFNQDTFSTKPKLTTVNSQKPTNPIQQSTTNTQIIYQPPSKRTNTIAPKHPTLNINSLISMNPSNHQKPQLQSLNSLTSSRLINSDQTSSFIINPNMQWHNIPSNSVYDTPQLSTKYSNIPLRITLPIVNPTHNQRYIVKYNPTLENRLLNAGLPPETIALYERILDIAEKHQLATKYSLPKIINQYPYQSFI